MSCSHCESAIKKCVGDLEGVTSVLVSQKDGTVSVKYNSKKVMLDKIKCEIDNQGYDII
ncbi:cation transporter [uncultured Clostridium sp.]|uniref:cation transporter n=1 Tax=uncultured Clostridium sp. TaxID=59620 RepID=UPI0028E418A1|nr:cation transporter [uncultured Clostridium sp.]